MLITIQHVLTSEEIAQFRQHLAQANWQDGVKTAGTLARSAKQNLQLDDASELARSLGNHLLRTLAANSLFVSAALPNKIYPPKFNCYTQGGHYGTHVDSAIMHVPGTAVSLRSDLSATLFLSDAEEYEGGELEIETAVGVQVIKLAAGDMVLYPSSSLHRVTPVTKGARIASFFWIESLVGDEAERSMLFDLDQAIQALTPAVAPDDVNLLKLTGVYHNLLRRWAAT